MLSKRDLENRKITNTELYNRQYVLWIEELLILTSLEMFVS